MKKVMLLILLGMGIACFALAQSPDHSVLSPAGGTASLETMTLDWTLGELAVESAYSSHKLYSQGFHQPILTIREVDISLEWKYDEQDKFDISLSPNPVIATLHLKIAERQKEELLVQLRNSNGQIVQATKLLPHTSDAELNLQSYASGTYFLNIFKENDLIKSFQISKIN